LQELILDKEGLVLTSLRSRAIDGSLDKLVDMGVPTETRGQERVKKLVFEAKMAEWSGKAARSAVILSPVLISVQPL